MTYSEIKRYIPINATDPDHVREIAESIRRNGWRGMPILVCNACEGALVTGTHRLAALQMLEADDYDVDALGDIAEDVSDYVDAWCDSEDETLDNFPHDNLSLVFANTLVEKYKDELIEW